MSERYRLIVREPGGPETIGREPIDSRPPGRGEIAVRVEAVGLNFIDVYHRTGLYQQPLPTGLGVEGAGTVETAGEGSRLAPGTRIAFLLSGPGAYATHLTMTDKMVTAIPDAIDTETAAAALLKSLTAWMLAERCARLEAGKTVLVHAAAGGVGSLLVQWCKALGATVIAHAGSPEKANKAKMLGADHSLSVPMAELADAVRGLTGDRGCDAVLDGVGAASWAASLASVARLGTLVSYGNASGPVAPVAPLALTQAGSIFFTRPTVYDHLKGEGAFEAATARLWSLIESDTLTVPIGRRLPLADAAEAHRALEARETTGATILTV